MLLISQNTVSKHFRLLQPGVDVIGFFDQYLSMQTGEWTPSTFKKYEEYTNPRSIQNYRRANGVIGYAIVAGYLIRKYWRRMF
jgi:hypothetical protein